MLLDEPQSIRFGHPGYLHSTRTSQVDLQRAQRLRLAPSIVHNLQPSLLRHDYLNQDSLLGQSGMYHGIVGCLIGEKAPSIHPVIDSSRSSIYSTTRLTHFFALDHHHRLSSQGPQSAYLSLEMDIFNGAQGVSFDTATFNNVQGNQTNTYILNQKEREYTIYDDYHKIINGDVYRVLEIHRERYPMHFIQSKQIQAETTICHAEIRQGFTAVSYRGPDAKKIWERDFQEFAEAADASHIQLFGLNCSSSVPLLIFHGELVPLPHIYNGIKNPLVEIYLNGLAVHLNCAGSELWIDPKQGTLIRGLRGPYPRIRAFPNPIKAPPSSVKFLQDNDILWCYLSQLPLERNFDRTVLMAIERWDSGTIQWLDQDINRPNQQAIISGLTNFTIAVGCPSWVSSYESECLHLRVRMPNGMTRFWLGDCGDQFSIWPRWNDYSWLSQATHVFDQCGISLDNDLSRFKVIRPWMVMEGKIEYSEVKRRLRQFHLAIYLFIPPFLPKLLLKCGLTVSHHFWSLDHTGQTHLSEHMCRFLGLPTKLKITELETLQFSWPTEVYKHIYRWQVHRGFDPKTTKFSHYLQNESIYKVIQPDSSRFEEHDGDA